LLLKKHHLLDSAMCRKLTTEFFTMRRAKNYQVWRVPNSAAFYNPATGCRVLKGVTPTIEKLTGKELLPSYCYGRLYTKGDALPQHTDRKASEYAVSITVGNSSDEMWPLWVENDEINELVTTEVGECVIYKGHEMLHWREELQWDWCAQLLLFYVDKNGKFKDLANEKGNHNFFRKF
jgi:hypothetical protein